MSSETLSVHRETSGPVSEGMENDERAAGGVSGWHLGGRRFHLFGFLASSMYRTCSVMSFGVVFPVVFAAWYVPKNNVFVSGLIDGSQAAIDAVARMEAARESGAPCAQSGRR